MKTRALVLVLAMVLPSCDGIPIPIPTPTPTPIPTEPGWDCDNPPTLSGLVAVKGGIPGSYTVRMRKLLRRSSDGTVMSLDASVNDVKAFTERFPVRKVEAWRGGWRGDMSAVTAAAVAQATREVEFLHSTIPVQASAVEWHLDRIDERQRKLDGIYNPGATGAGVIAAVVDTGVDRNHVDYKARLRSECFIAPGIFGACGADDHGHGTHVAGIILGNTFGVAKKAELIGVKVLASNGSGTDAGVAAGIDYVRSLKEQHPDWKMVLNMSLGGDWSPALNSSVCDAHDAGVALVVAAGNDYEADACRSSPSGVRQALTIGAMDKNDRAADFSNAGQCVDLYMPGVDVVSARMGGGSIPMSGTSMGAPGAAGLAALALERGAIDVHATVVGAGTLGLLSGVPAGTPNLLGYARMD